MCRGRRSAGEFRHQTITQPLQVEPCRPVFLLATLISAVPVASHRVAVGPSCPTGGRPGGPRLDVRLPYGDAGGGGILARWAGLTVLVGYAVTLALTRR